MQLSGIRPKLDYYIYEPPSCIATIWTGSFRKILPSRSLGGPGLDYISILYIYSAAHTILENRNRTIIPWVEYTWMRMNGWDEWKSRQIRKNAPMRISFVRVKMSMYIYWENHAAADLLRKKMMCYCRDIFLWLTSFRYIIIIIAT